MILGSGLLQSSWPRASDWLIKDEFTDTVAAGSVNGTAATPGPGTRAVTDTGSNISVGSGILDIIAPTSPGNFSDTILSHGPTTRSAGVALVAKGHRTTADTSNLNGPILYFATSASDNGRTAGDNGIYFVGGGGLTYIVESNTLKASGLMTWAQNQSYTIAIVARSTGATYIVDNKIIWVSNSGNTASLYGNVSVEDAGAEIDYLRVLPLPAPFDTDDGLATDSLAGSVAAGTTFSHTADMLLEFTVTALPSDQTVRVAFRYVDANNNWYVFITNDGTIALYERVAGTATIRGTAATVLSNGHRVVIVCEDTTLKVYSNNTLRLTYSSASNFATATAGEVLTLGTGGAVSDLKTWPRTLSGTAASILNKVSA